jgi:hypothetical protein
MTITAYKPPKINPSTMVANMRGAA